MSARSSTPRSERIDVRLKPYQKARLLRAAEIEGVSLSDYVISKVSAAAEETIRAHEVMTLSERDSTLFAEALADPPAPNEALQAAARRYREFTNQPSQE